MSDLRNVPGIGAKKEAELVALGYPTLESLKDADPDDLYLRASVNEGQQLDKCVPLRGRLCERPCARPGEVSLVVFCG